MGIWTAVAEASAAKRRRTATPLWIKIHSNAHIQAKAASTLRFAAAVQKRATEQASSRENLDCGGRGLRSEAEEDGDTALDKE